MNLRKMEKKIDNEKIINVFLTLIGVPSLIFIFGIVLIIYSFSIKDYGWIAFICGIFFWVVDWVIFHKDFSEIIEKIKEIFFHKS